MDIDDLKIELVSYQTKNRQKTKIMAQINSFPETHGYCQRTGKSGVCSSHISGLKIIF